ncbi:MAG TPA: hypothetical protein VEQ10_07000, partial [Vicinamibacteria bacterium]|nr:hypothetical protein [Vicinamibacteria bacterium]
MTCVSHPGRVLLGLGVAWLAAVALAATPQAAQEPQQAPTQLAPAKGEIIPTFETLGIDGQAHKVTFPKGSKTV